MVVLIHGLGRTRVSMMPVAYRLQQSGFETALVGYWSLTQTLRQSTASVARQVERKTAHWKGPVHLVGHSLGGLIALRLKREYPELNIKRVVQLGSPNLGSPAADTLKGNSLASWFFGPVLAELSEDLTLSEQRDPDVAATANSAWGREASVRLAAPTIHTGLPLSRSVAEATVAFLKTGHAEMAE